jgi:dCMP deaminase
MPRYTDYYKQELKEEIKKYLDSLVHPNFYLSATSLAKYRPSKHETFMEIARVVAKRSTCDRMQVGCVITDEFGEKIAIGYNGGPKGGRNKCARKGTGVCGCLHGETNAVIKADFPGRRIAYVTISPCELCAIALINAHVEELHVGNVYRNENGLNVFRELGYPVYIYSGKIINPK